MVLQVLAYIGLLTFLVFGAKKVLQFARMPLHLRWELYPVAHEVGRPWGGSYVEDLDWWTKPIKTTRLGELRYFLREAFLFEKAFHNNRGLWYWTYPFHMGLFLIVVWLILLLFGAVAMPGGQYMASQSNWVASAIFHLTMITGIAGLILGTLGCLGLLIRRLTNESLKRFTAPIDYLNLMFLLAIMGIGLLSWLFFDPVFDGARGFVRSLFTSGPAEGMNPLLAISVVLFSFFLIYMPFTHMMHMVTKYFTYHRVFWEDEPNLRGNRVRAQVHKLLEQEVTWSGPHVGAGKKWKEIVIPEEQEKSEK